MSASPHLPVLFSFPFFFFWVVLLLSRLQLVLFLTTFSITERPLAVVNVQFKLEEPANIIRVLTAAFSLFGFFVLLSPFR